jgi:cell surface protein SprA
VTFSPTKYFILLFSGLFSGLLANAQNDSLVWPLNENNAGTGGVYMDPPESYTEEVIYQPEDNTYLIIYKMGNVEVGRETLNYAEYTAYRERQKREDYWRKKENDRINGEESNSLIPALNIAGEAFKGIFGSNKIEIRPQGTVELIMGGIFNTNLNPSIPLQQRRTGNFDFKQNIQLNVTGKIGDKININTNFNTQEMFNFKNKLNLKYEGQEDDILKLIELGNVQMTLPGSLITGMQSLFGGKVQLQFGRLKVTGLFSQQRGTREEVNVAGGAQIQKFEISAADYEANKHYFLGEYFKQQYDNALRNVPLINSNIRITRLEIWVTNKVNAVQNVRNIVAALPVGESTWPINTAGGATYPDNAKLPFYNPASWTQSDRTNVSSAKFQSLENGTEIEYLNNARLLNPNEYTFNDLLGYISLNQPLNNDEVLAVAYQFTAADGKLYQVGEFSTDVQAPETIMLKLLKSTGLNVKKPNWNWMMKNIYNIGGFGISQEKFVMNVLYRDVEKGVLINFIPDPSLPTGVKETPLLKVFNLDRLNPNNDQQPDGFFDYIEGITMQSQNGRIIFPVREPFGFFLRGKIGIPSLADRYAFDSLYTTIQPLAKLYTERNRFYLGGNYQSSVSSEIQLNALNIEPGSVTVTAGGQMLQENVDYTVDYTLGRVKIINTGLLTSGTPIKVSMETNQLFNQQVKRMAGTRLDYTINKNFVIGATLMNLNERPFTQKVNIGEEPINNTIWGFDFSYNKELPWLTRAIDRIPGISTKAPSKVTLFGEFAHLIPGHNRVIGKEGISQVDDFEGAESVINYQIFSQWRLGTAPHRQTDRFPHAERFNDLRSGYGRSLMTWYNMDPIFFRQNAGATPEPIFSDKNSRSNHYVREVRQVEVFPNLNLPPGQQPNINVFDVGFFPTERGPYNFDFASLNADGKIADPRKSWGSIMRRTETTDWDGANIDYIEFWLMDPFDKDLDELKVWETGDNTATNANRLPDGGGDLLIQIGNMTEDVLQDGKFYFENGMPTPTNNLTANETVWGRVPGEQVINQAFSNGTDERPFQDIGYDGLTSEPNFNDPLMKKEQDHFSSLLTNLPAVLSPDAISSILADPSADNFRPFIGGMYTNTGSTPVPGSYIHERYKKFQLPEGNSPEADIAAANSQFPNSEDINNDNTLNQSESYFQYKVSIRKNDFQLGNNYITDSIRVNVSVPNGQTKQITWYQFRVPVRSNDREAFGNISDWRSIRFIRMVAQGFPDDVYLRFARFELVRADWRRFQADLLDPVPFPPINPEPSFNVFTVNIYENSQKQPFNYKLPQGVTQEIDPANPALQQLNEQSLALDVCNLPDGVAKAVFKTANLDLRAYKNLEMFIHAEDKLQTLQDGDISVFVRIGTDPSDNYYEYEIPVEFSKLTGATDQQAVDNIWPLNNKMQIPLQDLPEVKRERNQAEISFNEIFSKILANGHRITVKGNPNLRDVKTILIGVRNPFRTLNPFNENDDGQAACVQVWVNELRVSDYFEKGGWAANLRMQTQLADLGTFNVAASHETFGFGSIDKRPLNRARNNTTMLDVSTNLEMAKFTPQKWGLSIPLFVGYNFSIARPQFNPVDPDVRMRDALNDLGSKERRDSLRSVSNEVMQRRAINLTNVRKNRTNSKRKPMPWDIENLDLTYAYQDQRISGSQFEYNNTFSHKASLGYSYAPTMKYWEPFSKVKGMKSKWLKWMKDFNFTPLPKQFTFRTDLFREFNEMKFRNNTEYELLIEPTFRKNYTWNRTYNFAYSPFKSFNITFNAVQNGRVDEPEGKIDTETKRDSLNRNLGRGGRTVHYTQNLNVAYNVPFSKFPLTDWMTANIGYAASFDFQSGQLLLNPNTGVLEKPWGNTISNSQNINIQGQLNFTSLYNKVPYLKNLNNPSSAKSTAKPKKEVEEPTDDNKKKEEKKPEDPKVKVVNFEDEGYYFRKDKPKMIKHKLKTEKVTVKVFDEEGKEVKGKVEVFDKNRVKFTPSRDAKKAKVQVEGKLEKKEINVGKELGRFFARILTGVKNVSVTYTRSEGTTLPGYINNSNMLGQDFSTGSPGFGFVFGEQFNGTNLARRAADNNWLTRDTTLNAFFLKSRTSNLNISATVEPIKSLRIQLSAQRQFTFGSQSLFRFDEGANDFRELSTLENGNFSISFMSIGTAFADPIGKDPSSPLFQRMLEYRKQLSQRLGGENPYSLAGGNQGLSTNDPGYRFGYNRNQQDVLMYSFLAAYSGRNPSDMSTDLFPTIPAINWNVTYDGLRNIGIFKKLLRNFVLSHAYRSTYSITGFMNNQLYKENDLAPGFTDVLDTNQNFVSRYILQNVSIIEAFSPLINFDMTWKNSLTTKFEVKKNRNLGMNFQNNQLTENSTMEYVFGAGYKIEKLRLPIIVAGKRLENDLNIRLDIGVRNNKTIVRRVPDATQTTVQEQVTAGQQNITIKFFVDYALSKTINIRLFFDHLRNNPFVANQFKTRNTNAGISLRFTLAP